MTDAPITEPEPRDERLDRTDGEEPDRDGVTRPSAADGVEEESAGARPPRPSQAEGERP